MSKLWCFPQEAAMLQHTMMGRSPNRHTAMTA